MPGQLKRARKNTQNKPHQSSNFVQSDVATIYLRLNLCKTSLFCFFCVHIEKISADQTILSPCFIISINTSISSFNHQSVVTIIHYQSVIIHNKKLTSMTMSYYLISQSKRKYFTFYIYIRKNLNI